MITKGDVLAILDTVVVKRDKVAQSCDTIDSIDTYNKVFMAYCRQDDIRNYPNIKLSMLLELGLTQWEAEHVQEDPYALYQYVSELQVERFLDRVREERINGYEERNEYYRMLAGLPPYGYPGDKIPFEIEGVDQKKQYVHELSNTEIRLIKQKGLMKKILDIYPNQKYIHYIDKRIDSITARALPEYSILYCEHTSNMIYEKFKEHFDKNRRYFMRTFYNQFYDDTYPYYEDVMILYLIGITTISVLQDVLVDSLDYDFTNEDVMKAIFESAGFYDYEDMSTMYRVRLVEKLNDLLINKGSKKIMLDLAKLFDVTYIYRYILHKKLKDNVNPSDILPLEEKYDLHFVRVPYDTKDIAKHIADPNASTTTFDTFVGQDNRWGLNDYKFKKEVLEKEFSHIETKYVAVENMVDITKMTLELSLFIHYIFKNKEKLNLSTVKHLQYKTEHKIFNMIIYIISLIYMKNGYVDSIPDTLEEFNIIYGMNTEQIFDDLALEFEMHFTHDKDDRDLVKRIKKLAHLAETSDLCDAFGVNLEVLRTLMYKFRQQGNYEKFKVVNDVITRMTQMKALKDIFGTAKKDENGNYVEVPTYSGMLRIEDPDLYARYIYVKEISVDSKVALIDEIYTAIESVIFAIDSMRRVVGDFFVDNLHYMDASEFDSATSFLRSVMDFFKSYTTDLRDFSIIFTIDHPDCNMYTVDDLTWFQTYEENDLTLEGDSIIDTVESCQNGGNTKDFIFTGVAEELYMKQNGKVDYIYEGGVNDTKR